MGHDHVEGGWPVGLSPNGGLPIGLKKIPSNRIDPIGNGEPIEMGSYLVLSLADVWPHHSEESTECKASWGIRQMVQSDLSTPYPDRDRE